MYRKYRPFSFRELIGQDIIVQALTSQIKTGKISHAYLFTGSRGTGKTSTARILARAINCESPVEGNPCGKCAQCKLSANLDIIELDAASNNGVDSIRELRDDVSYLPSSGKYKVYIIDEVHMLSASAYNALLKTLEEPPQHVIFVLCTTNPEKISATILSRCMRFDFHLVPVEILAKHLKTILGKEGVKADDEAVMHIAKLGEGSVRDMLSIADRCITVGSDLTIEKVLDITGTGRTDDCLEITRAAFGSQPGAIIQKIEDLASRGRSIPSVSSDLASFARDVMLIKATGENTPGLTKDAYVKIKALADTIPFDFLLSFVRALGQADSEIRYSLSPKTVLECALLSVCKFDDGIAAPVIAKREYASPTAVRSREEVLSVIGFIRRELDKRNLNRLGGVFSSLSPDSCGISGDVLTITVESKYFDILNETKNKGCLNEICKEKNLKPVIVKKEEPVQEDGDLDFLNESGLEVEIVSGRKRR